METLQIVLALWGLGFLGFIAVAFVNSYSGPLGPELPRYVHVAYAFWLVAGGGLLMTIAYLQQT